VPQADPFEAGRGDRRNGMVMGIYGMSFANEKDQVFKPWEVEE
jgi:hypothetical protein